MPEDWGQREDGLFIPSEESPLPEGILTPSVDAPIFRFIFRNLTTEWSMKNWETVWTSPIYDEVSSVWTLTMKGIDIQKADGFGDTVPGTIVSRMMARGLTLTRTACLAMAFGSPMDALACYRMLFDRALTLQFLDKNNQYSDFERFCWAEVYFWLDEALSLPTWRDQATSKEVQSNKDRQATIKEKYFDGAVPKMANTYWKAPNSAELVRTFSLHLLGLPEPEGSDVSKAMKRLYELGSKAVHPRIGDMVETEELGWSEDSRECMSLVLMALTCLTAFGLSRHSGTEFLVNEIANLAIKRHESN